VAAGDPDIIPLQLLLSSAFIELPHSGGDDGNMDEAVPCIEAICDSSLLVPKNIFTMRLTA